jgi:RNA polymerase sigma factor (sigma-70 family)
MTIHAIKQSDQVAFEKTYFHWHAKIYAYFIHKTSSDYMAEELVQLTFIKLWNSRHTLKTELPLEAQLFTIARTTMLDFLRKQANQLRLITVAKSELSSYTEPVWEIDNKNKVHHLIHTLPPVRKQVFILNRYEGYSNIEIAQKLAISIRTVEKHISLAIKQLKSKLLSVIIFFIHYVYFFF